MREIKFRAWYPEAKVMVNVGQLTFYVSGKTIVNATNIEKVKLMQYTGLKDKNGKEIYEGDIIALGIEKKPDFFRYEIVWGFLGFNLKRLGEDKIEFPFKKQTPIFELEKEFLKSEVIGNIYENEDLLK